jgi:monofunctional biosynthetic peptidoglycan transglycosylase
MLAALLAQVPDHSQRTLLLTDFSAPDFVWRSIDDAVMGGVSRSRFTVEDGKGVFTGEVSLENNGGFASVRTDPRDLDLSVYAGIALRVRTDGKRYAFRLRMSEAFDGISYEAVIPPGADDWREVRLPFTAFQPVFRGRSVPDAPKLDPAKLKTLGFMIADEQAGAYRLEIGWIKAYLPQSEALSPREEGCE